MELNPSEAVSVLATVINVLLFLSGMHVVSSILKQGSTKGYFVLPFISSFVCCTLWTKYGLLTKDKVIIFVNFAGSVIEGLYVLIFYISSKKKSGVLSVVLWMFLVLLSLLAYTKYITVQGSKAIYHHGIICSVYNIFNYAAPLSAATTVIRKKSTENLSFVLSVLYFLCALFWYLYGVIHNDYFIQVPNFLGIAFGAFQLGLFACYSSKRIGHKNSEQDIKKTEQLVRAL